MKYKNFRCKVIPYKIAAGRWMGKAIVLFIPSGECCDQLFRWQWMMTF